MMMKDLPLAIALQVRGDPGYLEDMAKKTMEAARRGAMFIEYRLDYATDPMALDINTIVQQARSVGLQCILTCRIASEGGNFDSGSENSIHLYQKMAIASPDYMDVELFHPMLENGNQKDEFKDLIAKTPARFILSYHDFHETPKDESLDNLLEKIRHQARKIIENTMKPPILKIVFMAHEPEDNLVPFEVIRTMNECGHPVISFCMGRAGILSRLLSILPRADGSKAGFLTFTSLHETTAPGQVSIITALEILGNVL